MCYLCTRFVPGHSRPTAGRSARRPRTALAARAHPGKQEPDQAPEGLEPAVVSAPGGGRGYVMTSRVKPSRSSLSSRRPKPPAGSRSTGRQVRQAALAEVKDDLSRFLRLAESEEILITRHGKAAGVLIGFESEDDWLDYRLEHHPEFLRRVAVAREALRSGRGVRLEDLPS